MCMFDVKLRKYVYMVLRNSTFNTPTLLLILLLTMLIAGSLLTSLGSVLGQYLFSLDIETIQDIDLSKEQNVRFMRFLQIFSLTGMFLIPSLLFFYIKELKMN